jgi:hypothetical protein
LLYEQSIDLFDSLCELNPLVMQHPNRVLQLSLKPNQNIFNILKLYPSLNAVREQPEIMQTHPNLNHHSALLDHQLITSTGQ